MCCTGRGCVHPKRQTLAIGSIPELPIFRSHLPLKVRVTEKGVEFKGGSLHDSFGAFDGFDGAGEHLALLLRDLQTQHNEATVAVLAVMAVSVVTATPLKLNPPFP